MDKTKRVVVMVENKDQIKQCKLGGILQVTKMGRLLRAIESISK